ncbi:sensor domain-containing diguanylate cyclase [Photobacterium sanguinicancri]|uniref:sensor domain-containing diguanylate cyclase n=2 Tax=Photobacterium sanguinicancri TaxID=875932 RepID=UPI0026E2ED25|nr:sensor domain-containing diguanylate cyclase [Photobacterium sanguinicancri]MDO6500486.1 sensor domain-containing diguanylate cyclase [Photobacterium sanguinicancri]
MTTVISNNEKIFIDSHYGVVVHRDFKPLYADDTYAAYYGYTSSEEVLALSSLLQLISQPERTKALATYDGVMSGRLKPGVRSYKNIDNAGNELIVLTVDHIVEWQGEPAMQITIIDLSSQIETQRQLKASEERYRELIDGSIQGIVVHRDLTPLFCNRAYAQMHGFENEQAMIEHGSILPLIALPFHQQAVEENAALITGIVETIKAEVKGFKVDGSTIWLSLLSRPVMWDGELAVQVTAMDITEQHILREKLEHQANYDGLTNLLNRRATSEILAQQFEVAKAEKQALSCVMIDLDNFKQINDQYGHQVGDEILCLFAAVSLQSLRNSDILGRWGGEEFILSLPGHNQSQAATVANRLCEALSQVAVETDLGPLFFSASMGVATICPEITTYDQLVSKADRALYQAKHNGKNCVALFNDIESES